MSIALAKPAPGRKAPPMPWPFSGCYWKKQTLRT